MDPLRRSVLRAPYQSGSSNKHRHPLRIRIPTRTRAPRPNPSLNVIKEEIDGDSQQELNASNSPASTYVPETPSPRNTYSTHFADPQEPYPERTPNPSSQWCSMHMEAKCAFFLGPHHNDDASASQDTTPLNLSNNRACPQKSSNTETQPEQPPSAPLPTRRAADTPSVSTPVPPLSNINACLLTYRHEATLSLHDNLKKADTLAQSVSFQAIRQHKVDLLASYDYLVEIYHRYMHYLTRIGLHVEKLWHDAQLVEYSVKHSTAQDRLMQRILGLASEFPTPEN